VGFAAKIRIFFVFVLLIEFLTSEKVLLLGGTRQRYTAFETERPSPGSVQLGTNHRTDFPTARQAGEALRFLGGPTSRGFLPLLAISAKIKAIRNPIA
jgi:hypothetical protein